MDRVRAIVGAQDIDGQLYVRSWVFYYLSGRRVAPPNWDLVEYEFGLRMARGISTLGSDEFDEFDPFETYN
ncbi:MAG: hypothetical protein J0L92_25560 [Deltaproteobacteria bacterium]|nr:hypothetical protein [Deltaproteobacteria bacterium]